MDKQADSNNDLGLHIDMLDVDRLREWARLILEHGADISYWGDRVFVASKLQTMATCMEKEIRDVGLLRQHCESAARDYRSLSAKLDVAERALDAIASPGTTADYGWWTETARKALRA